MWMPTIGCFDSDVVSEELGYCSGLDEPFMYHATPNAFHTRSIYTPYSSLDLTAPIE